MTQGQPLDQVSSNPRCGRLQKDKLINSDFLSQEQELEYTDRLQQVMARAELKFGHSIERGWKDHDGGIQAKAMRTRNYGKAKKSG